MLRRLLFLVMVGASVPSVYAICSSYGTAASCLSFSSSGCAWCNASYAPSTSGVCYNSKTEQCCSAYNECQHGPFQNAACLNNQTCCTPIGSGPPTCCAPGMKCCQGLCYDPQVNSCCPESYPMDLCGGPTLCGLTDSCCSSYYSTCCANGYYCCSDYHGNSGCFPNDYPVRSGRVPDGVSRRLDVLWMSKGVQISQRYVC